MVKSDFISLEDIVKIGSELFKIDICEDIVYAAVLKQVLLYSYNKHSNIPTSSFS